MDAQISTPRCWIGWSLIAGCVLGVPAGCLLAYLAVLPLFLGLFFFLVIGLIVGAVMFRLGRLAGPRSKASLWLIGSVVVLVIWGTGLVVEYLGFPRDATRAVLKSIPQRLTPEQRADLYIQTRRYVLARFVGGQSEPGRLGSLRGFPAYLRWAATDGTIACPRVFNDSTHKVSLPQRRVGWVIRVGASLALLAFAILAQFLSLPRACVSRSAESRG